MVRRRRIKLPETAGGAARLFLLQVRDGVGWGELFKKGFEDLGLVVDREVEPIQTVGQKLIDDDFDDRPVTYGDERLGENAGEGREPGSLPPSHDDDRQIEATFWLDGYAALKHLLPEQQPHYFSGRIDHRNAAEIAVQHVLADLLRPKTLFDHIGFAITDMKHLRLEVAIGQDPTSDVAIRQ